MLVGPLEQSLHIYCVIASVASFSFDNHVPEAFHGSILCDDQRSGMDASFFFFLFSLPSTQLQYRHIKFVESVLTGSLFF